MTDPMRPSRRGLSEAEMLKLLVDAHNRGTDLDAPLNICDHCGAEIPLGEMGILVQVTEIVPGSLSPAPHFPASHDLEYQFQLFCSTDCLRDWAIGICKDKA